MFGIFLISSLLLFIDGIYADCVEGTSTLCTPFTYNGVTYNSCKRGFTGSWCLIEGQTGRWGDYSTCGSCSSSTIQYSSMTSYKSNQSQQYSQSTQIPYIKQDETISPVQESHRRPTRGPVQESHIVPEGKIPTQAAHRISEAKIPVQRPHNESDGTISTIQGAHRVPDGTIPSIEGFRRELTTRIPVQGDHRVQTRMPVQGDHRVQTRMPVQGAHRVQTRMPVQGAHMESTARMPVQTLNRQPEAKMPVQRPHMESTARIPVKRPDMESTARIPVKRPHMESTARIPVKRPHRESTARIPVKRPDMESTAIMPVKRPDMESTAIMPVQRPHRIPEGTGRPEQGSHRRPSDKQIQAGGNGQVPQNSRRRNPLTRGRMPHRGSNSRAAGNSRSGQSRRPSRQRGGGSQNGEQSDSRQIRPSSGRLTNMTNSQQVEGTTNKRRWNGAKLKGTKRKSGRGRYTTTSTPSNIRISDDRDSTRAPNPTLTTTKDSRRPWGSFWTRKTTAPPSGQTTRIPPSQRNVKQSSFPRRFLPSRHQDSRNQTLQVKTRKKTTTTPLSGQTSTTLRLPHSQGDVKQSSFPRRFLPSRHQDPRNQTLQVKTRKKTTTTPLRGQTSTTLRIPPSQRNVKKQNLSNFLPRRFHPSRRQNPHNLNVSSSSSLLPRKPSDTKETTITPPRGQTTRVSPSQRNVKKSSFPRRFLPSRHQQQRNLTTQLSRSSSSSSSLPRKPSSAAVKRDRSSFLLCRKPQAKMTRAEKAACNRQIARWHKSIVTSQQQHGRNMTSSSPHRSVVATIPPYQLPNSTVWLLPRRSRKRKGKTKQRNSKHKNRQHLIPPRKFRPGSSGRRPTSSTSNLSPRRISTTRSSTIAVTSSASSSKETSSSVESTTTPYIYYKEVEPPPQQASTPEIDHPPQASTPEVDLPSQASTPEFKPDVTGGGETEVVLTRGRSNNSENKDGMNNSENKDGMNNSENKDGMNNSENKDEIHHAKATSVVRIIFVTGGAVAVIFLCLVGIYLVIVRNRNGEVPNGNNTETRRDMEMQQSTTEEEEGSSSKNLSEEEKATTTTTIMTSSSTIEASNGDLTIDL